ncbi:MAG: hypothetical protein AB8C95_03305, partial [Phycisphaeraceae bacterium]
GKGNKKGEMSCGGCGYSVRGLQALNCPECGADLRHIGINRGQNSGSRALGIVLTMGCGGLLMLGCFGSAFLFVSQGKSANIQSIQVQQSMPSTSIMTQSVPADGEDAEDVEVEGEDPSGAEIEPTR